ncbi:MAG: HAD family phosphatase [Nanoarchaeota archaeon]|nr:HAD family phosphatase [Nanoarchaeota archaeon]
MIKCIIFDLGNVVLTNDWHIGPKEKEKASEFCDYFSVSEEDLERAWHQVWPDYERGKFSEDEFWIKFLTEAGAKKIDTEKGKELWRKYQYPVNALFILIENLKRKYKVVALANVGSEWLDFKMKKFDLNKYFDKIIGSGKCGWAKPDKRIYEFALKEIDFKPEECIFIDDKEINLKPARELGIKTILFESKEQLITDLEKLFD